MSSYDDFYSQNSQTNLLSASHWAKQDLEISSLLDGDFVDLKISKILISIKFSPYRTRTC